MRFDPWIRPVCDQPACGTVDILPCLARLIFDDDGTAEYSGQTDVDWEGQATPQDDEGRVTLQDAMQFFIQPRGVVQCVYDEQIDVRVLGSPDIRRASHVEPTPDGRWTADLSPVDGPTLGRDGGGPRHRSLRDADLSPVDGPTLGPFHRRSDALAAEKRWLEGHWLGRLRAKSSASA